MDVILLYDLDCPNVPATRSNLIHAFVRAGAAVRWREVDRAAHDTPSAWKGYGSPTILIDGVELTGLSEACGEASCRVYVSSDGLIGVPSIELIHSRLLEAARVVGSCSTSKVAGAGSLTTPTAWKRVFGALPAITVALLPKVACPACWPAYAGLLSSVGLGFLMQNRYLLPLTVVFLSGALVTLGWRARQRRGFGPLLMGGLAAAVILAAKFYFESDAAMYVGVAGLIGASVWNSWPRKRTASCPACVNV